MGTSIPSLPTDVSPPHLPTLPPPHPSPPNPPASNPGTLDDMLLRHSQYARIRYRACLGLLIVCPLVAALPPRRLNFYTFGLAGVWLFALDEVVGQNRNRIPWMSPLTVNAAAATNPTPDNTTPEVIRELRKVEEEKKRSRYAERVREKVGDKEEQGKSISEILKDNVYEAYRERREKKGEVGNGKEDGMRRFIEEVVMDADGTTKRL